MAPLKRFPEESMGEYLLRLARAAPKNKKDKAYKSYHIFLKREDNQRKWQGSRQVRKSRQRMTKFNAEKRLQQQQAKRLQHVRPRTLT